jgi:hypothetical protein
MHACEEEGAAIDGCDGDTLEEGTGWAAIDGCDRDTRGGQRTLRRAAKDGQDRDAKQPNTAADGNNRG